MAEWHVFYSHIQAEKLASESISDLGFETFIPYEKRIQRRPNRKPRIIESPLFPRYGFVKFDVDDPWGTILDAKGVMQVLTSNNKPCTVHARIIDGLQLAAKMGVMDRTKPPEIGMRVEATSGPFMDWLGKVTKARGRDRVKVLFTLLGATREIDMPLSMLRTV